MASIDEQAWGTTLLARQHLLSPVDEDAIEVLDRCVGMQAQDPRAPFYGLWSRIAGFEHSELDDLLNGREVVRMALLRSTIFLVDAEDARWIRPLAATSLEAEIRTVHRKRLDSADPAAIIDVAADLLRDRPMSGEHLRGALLTEFPGEPPATLVAIARCGLPLVQVPPRGTWSGGGGVRYALFDDWVGPGEPAIAGEDAVRELIRLYLRGFGPASVASVQSWSGLTGLRPVMAAMEAEWELERLDGPDGIELYDLDGLPRGGGEPAPARLVAPFDHVVVAHADRRRVIDEELFRRTQVPNGISPGFVLVDGRVAATWKRTGTAAGEDVAVDYLVSVPASRRRAVETEVQRLGAWCA